MTDATVTHATAACHGTFHSITHAFAWQKRVGFQLHLPPGTRPCRVGEMVIAYHLGMVYTTHLWLFWGWFMMVYGIGCTTVLGGRSSTNYCGVQTNVLYPDEMTHVTCALSAEPFAHNEAVACAISGA